ncbi:MAG: PAS domain-containing protein [Pseudomonadota bacterium]
MKHDNTRALYRYWDDLRSGRAAPYRCEVDPRAISSLLESTFILERLGDDNIRFRLAGTKLCENFGLELRGMSALSLWQGDCRIRARNLLQQVCEEPCIGHIACTVETRAGYLFDAEFLFLPLRSDTGELTRILGCGYYMGGYEREFGGHAPIHHWIDNVSVYKIASQEAAEASGRDMEGPALREAISLLNQHNRFGYSAKPKTAQLRAIEGGLAALQDNGPRTPVETPSPRARGHLRLVKSDNA